MIVPSIDLMQGQTVQLRHGREKLLDAGDPRPIAQRFGLVGEIAVIDLDAAIGSGTNAPLVEAVLPLARCRVGGGIRDAATARAWLDRGAAKVILGTAARPDVLRELPRDRVIAAVDAWDGEVVVEGWRTKAGTSVIERISELAPFVGGFLVTFVETEGTLRGLDKARAESLLLHAGGGRCRVTVAGGVAEASEIGELDRLGVDAHVGMALYTGRFDLADAVSACLVSDRPDELWPTVVVDERGVALGLCYSNRESLRTALAERRGVYHSRTRGLWRKGETSGAAQELLAVDMDCDRDALRFTVRQRVGDSVGGSGEGFCHLGTRTCWGNDAGLGRLARRLIERRRQTVTGSYTSRLLADPTLLNAKLREEADELTSATSAEQIAREAADVLYFTLAKLAASDVSLESVERELDRREMQLIRRAGDAKAGYGSISAQEGNSR